MDDYLIKILINTCKGFCVKRKSEIKEKNCDKVPTYFVNSHIELQGL